MFLRESLLVSRIHVHSPSEEHLLPYKQMLDCLDALADLRNTISSTNSNPGEAVTHHFYVTMF